jgi:lactoylglutathione lyase
VTSTSAFPIISTPDLKRSLGFYRDLLGGVVTYQFPPTGAPGYVAIDIGASHLGIAEDPMARPSTGNQRFSLWVYTTSCDADVERMRAAGVHVTEEPKDQPWGERVARVLDPDGNSVVIGQQAPGA